MTFYDLKRALFFPQIAGFMRTKKDVAYLYDLLVFERVQTQTAMFGAVSALVMVGHKDVAERVKQDAKMIDETYRHDIALCANYMLENGIKPI